MPEPSEDFRDVIERSQRVTGDLAGMFSSAGARTAFEARRAPAGNDLDFDAHVHVFKLPEGSADYEDVLNKCLRGEATIRYEERTFNKEGDFLVAICYLVPRERPRAAPNQDAGDAERIPRAHKLP